MYCVLQFISPDSFSFNSSRIHEIRKRECENYRDKKAREMIKELEKQRKLREDNPTFHKPALQVCRSMNHLPDSPLKREQGIE